MWFLTNVRSPIPHTSIAFIGVSLFSCCSKLFPTAEVTTRQHVYQAASHFPQRCICDKHCGMRDATRVTLWSDVCPHSCKHARNTNLVVFHHALYALTSK